MHHSPNYLPRTLLLVVALACLVTPAFAQSSAIQPCDATPSTTKPTITNAPVKTGVASSQTVIDDSIPADPEVEKLLAPYSQKVRALSLVIGRLELPLKKELVGGGSLGNFVTDGMRSYSEKRLGKPVALTIMNAGGLRKNMISAGDLRASDIFELLPFENALMVVELSGTNLLKVLPPLLRDPQSGARLQYKWNDQSRPELIRGKLIDERGHEQEIDPNKIYTIVTIDYLLKVGGGAYAVLKEAKSVTPLNITLRDAVMEYVKNAAASGVIRPHLDDRYVQVGPGPKSPPEEPR
jgi:2',3'-cyclic-nucleotide 2'-phosphodiesterase (5'-nucleotidase family)